MNKTLIAAAAALLLAGCGSSNSAASGSAAGDTSAPSSGAPSASSGASAPSAGLSTSATSLGTIVVDTAGRTVYRYDADKQGATSSACTGGCAAAWPAVPAGSVSGGSGGSGVTGKVGSITGVDGKAQATLDGWPLYYYADDAQPGDTTGQSVGGTWWVVTPAGGVITGAPSASSQPGSQSGGHGY